MLHDRNDNTEKQQEPSAQGQANDYDDHDGKQQGKNETVDKDCGKEHSVNHGYGPVNLHNSLKRIESKNKQQAIGHDNHEDSFASMEQSLKLKPIELDDAGGSTLAIHPNLPTPTNTATAKLPERLPATPVKTESKPAQSGTCAMLRSSIMQPRQAAISSWMNLSFQPADNCDAFGYTPPEHLAHSQSQTTHSQSQNNDDATDPPAPEKSRMKTVETSASILVDEPEPEQRQSKQQDKRHHHKELHFSGQQCNDSIVLTQRPPTNTGKRHVPQSSNLSLKAVLERDDPQPASRCNPMLNQQTIFPRDGCELASEIVIAVLVPAVEKPTADGLLRGE